MLKVPKILIDYKKIYQKELDRSKTKDNVIAGLKGENTKLRNEIKRLESLLLKLTV